MRCVTVAYLYPRALDVCRDFRDGRYVYSVRIVPAEEWSQQFGVGSRTVFEYASPDEAEALDKVVDFIIEHAREYGFELRTVLHMMIYRLLTR